MHWRIENGISVNMWFDLWLHNEDGFHVSSPIVPGFENLLFCDLFYETC